jgi:YgiT-type zinc finger domain-containing protein
MNCAHCKGQLRRTTVPFEVSRNGYHVRCDALPAWVCEQCGEGYFEPSEVARVQRALQALEAGE